MSIIRVLQIAAASLLFLVGADHQESPALSLSSASGAVYKFEVLSWSWIGGKDRNAGLPGKSKSALFIIAGGKNAEWLERWRSEKTVLAKAAFESQKSGEFFHFILTGVTIESVDRAAMHEINGVSVVFGFRDVEIEERPAR